MEEAHEIQQRGHEVPHNRARHRQALPTLSRQHGTNPLSPLYCAAACTSGAKTEADESGPATEELIANFMNLGGQTNEEPSANRISLRQRTGLQKAWQSWESKK